MSDIDYLVCGGPEDGPAMPGARPGQCSECGAHVDIAPSGQRKVARGFIVLCLRCGYAKARDDGTPVELPTMQDTAFDHAYRRRN